MLCQWTLTQAGSSGSGAVLPNPGGAQSHSRSPQVMSAELMSAETMEIDGETYPAPTIPAWAQPIFNYLRVGTLPDDEIFARQIERRAKSYTIINKELYKRSVTSVLQSCISPE